MRHLGTTTTNDYRSDHLTERTMQKITPTKRTSAIMVALAAGALLLSGCAATAAAPTSASSGQPAQSSQAPTSSGVSGTIAAATNGTLQVQGGTTQTAVTYTASTTISQAVAAAASDVTVGSCVIGVTAPGASAGTAAATVAISAAVNGTCSTPGLRGGGQGGVRPSGAPNGVRPSGGPAGGFTPPVSGTVTAVSGSAITVATTRGGSATTATITLDGSTKYTKSQAATPAALVVNKCVVAAGKADTAGNFAATSLAVSDPGANGCSLGGRPAAGN
jgi:hypothetical protein